MGDRGSEKAYTVPRTKFGCDRSIVVGCRSWNDRHPDRQTSWSDNKAHSLRCTANVMQQWWQSLCCCTAVKVVLHTYDRQWIVSMNTTLDRLYHLVHSVPEKKAFIIMVVMLLLCCVLYYQLLCDRRLKNTWVGFPSQILQLASGLNMVSSVMCHNSLVLRSCILYM